MASAGKSSELIIMFFEISGLIAVSICPTRILRHFHTLGKLSNAAQSQSAA